MNPLYVGIDVSSKSNVVYFMPPDGSKHSNFSVANSHNGSSQLVKRILSAMTSCSFDTVLIGLEATSVYGDNLVYFLREDAALARFNLKIHVLNPKQVSKFKEAYNDLPKNDFIYSFVIADCLRSGNRFLKYYLCEAAFSLVRCDKEYSDFYHLKYKEVNRYQHKRALALTARKFVRLVFRLLKDNRLYTSAE